MKYFNFKIGDTIKVSDTEESVVVGFRYDLKVVFFITRKVKGAYNIWPLSELKRIIPYFIDKNISFNIDLLNFDRKEICYTWLDLPSDGFVVTNRVKECFKCKKYNPCYLQEHKCYTCRKLK